MPLRLIAGFDQRWRDTPVKTAAACSRSLALYSSLIPSLPLSLCSSIHPLFIPLHLSFAPTSLYLFCLSSSVPSWKHVYILKDQRGHLVFPPRFPGACLVMPTPDSWPVALPDTPVKRAALTSTQRSARAYVHLLPTNDTKANPDSNTNTHIGCAVEADVSAAI